MSYRDRILPSSLVLLILTTLVSSLFSTTSSAANRRSPDELPWYEIEILIFANKEQKGLDTETWPENTPDINYNHVINLRFPSRNRGIDRQFDTNPATGSQNFNDPNAPLGLDDNMNSSDVGLPEAFAYIDRSTFRLSAIRARLDKSAKFEPLLHLGWRQPTAKPKKALPVYIYFAMDNPNYQSALGPPMTDPNRIGFSQVEQGYTYPIGPKNSRLYGVVTLSVSRYLHVKTDLHYRAPVLQQEYILEQPTSGFFESNAEPIERLIERDVLLDFTMIESRRMRSKEIHYFDHPMFGLIVLVTPVDVTGDS
ncbi:MAG: CsiV family protein [Thiohalomonadales bacterium]